MLGELTDEQINNILYKKTVAHLGCQDNNEVYVVPVTYAFDGQYIYVHSKEGRKVNMMRNNPKVCLVVEALEDMKNWNSVVAWGDYEELVDEQDRHQAMDILSAKIAQLNVSETARPLRQTMAPTGARDERKTVIYRIKIYKKTGRFEKN